jgi:hypothetical protein
VIRLGPIPLPTVALAPALIATAYGQGANAFGAAWHVVSPAGIGITGSEDAR